MTRPYGCGGGTIGGATAGGRSASHLSPKHNLLVSSRRRPSTKSGAPVFDKKRTELDAICSVVFTYREASVTARTIVLASRFAQKGNRGEGLRGMLVSR